MSKSSSSPTNTTSTTTSTQETNLLQEGAGDLGIANSSGNTVNISETDDNAVADATSLGQSAISANSNVALKAECLAGSIAASASQEVSAATEANQSVENAAMTDVANASSPNIATNTTVKYFLIGAVGIGAVIALIYWMRK